MDRYEESKIPSRAHPAGTRRYPIVVNVKALPCVAWPAEISSHPAAPSIVRRERFVVMEDIQLVANSLPQLWRSYVAVMGMTVSTFVSLNSSRTRGPTPAAINRTPLSWHRT
jgi:hypothetical protein